MKITTLLFGLSGVIITDDWGEGSGDFMPDFARRFGTTEQDMLAAWENECRELFFAGKISENEFWERAFKVMKAQGDVEDAKKMWRSYVKPADKNIFELLRSLKKRYRLALLCNASHEWFDYKDGKFRLRDYFDVIVTSADAGVAKPDPDFFELAVETLGASPYEVLAIDSRIKNVEAAKKVAIKAVVFGGMAQFMKTLYDMNIEFEVPAEGKSMTKKQQLTKRRIGDKADRVRHLLPEHLKRKDPHERK